METGLPVNWVDGVVLLVVLGCLALGLITGFVMQLAGILSVAAGITVALLGGPLIGTALSRWVETPALASLIGYVGAFAVASTLVRVLAGCLSALMKRWKLERYDRLAGGLVGAAKGLLICAVLLIIGGRVGPASVQESVSGSLLGPVLLTAVDAVMAWASDSTPAPDAATLLDEADQMRRQGARRLQNALEPHLDKLDREPPP